MILERVNTAHNSLDNSLIQIQSSSIQDQG